MEHRGRDTLIESLMESALELARAVKLETEKHLSGPSRLTLSRLMVLRLLARKGSSTVRDVAAFLGVSVADASGIIDKLVSRKLLRRVESKSDRRIREVSLTPTAHQLLAEYEKARKSLLAETFRNCSSEELRHASELLDRVAWCVANRGRASNGHEEPAQAEVYWAMAGFE